MRVGASSDEVEAHYLLYTTRGWLTVPAVGWSVITYIDLFFKRGLVEPLVLWVCDPRDEIPVLEVP